MFAIDFTKPYLYKDVVYFHQGNLSTNNTLRCTLNTGGSNDLTGCNIMCTFKLQNSTEISGVGRIIDTLNAIVDLVFPSNALAVGLNKLEILVNRSDGSVAQSPSITYDIWQGLTTGNGIEAETNYPILIELINSTNEASNKANSALNKANSMITDITDAIDNTYRSANEADIATSNANTKIEEVETAKTEMIKKVDNSIVTMKSEVETAKNEMVSKTDEKIADVDRALAAGTVDLELKQAREDASGVIHDTIKQRLDSDLIVGDKSLKDFVIDMNGMKESQDLAYETDNSYQVCTDTQSGVVKDLKVYGKTVINNIIQLNEFRGSTSVTYANIVKWTPLINGEIYTFIPYNLPSYIKYMYFGNSDSTKVYLPRTGQLKPTNFIASDSVGLDMEHLIPHFYLENGTTVTQEQLNELTSKVKVLIIKGDYTKNPPPYFEGMANVGNGTPLEIITSNENLFNESLLKDRLEDDGYYHFRSTGNTRASLFIGIVNKSNQQITSMTSNQANDLTNLDLKDCKVLIGMNGDVKDDKLLFPITDFALGNFSIYKGCDFEVVDPNHIRVKNIYFKHGLDKGEYTPYKLDRKPMLYKDANGAWKPVTELKGTNDTNRRDIIDTENNTYTKMIKEVIEKGEGGWQVADNSKSDTVMFLRMFTESERCELLENNANICCDKFDSRYVYSADREGIFINRSMESSNGGVYIRIKASKLTSRDVVGLKQWLQNNNTRYTYKGDIVYKYELNPIYPDSYEGDTMVMIKGGLLPIKASWKITSSLPNFVKELSNQIKQLQDQVYKTNVANFTVALNTLDTKLRLDRLEAPQQ